MLLRYFFVSAKPKSSVSILWLSDERISHASSFLSIYNKFSFGYTEVINPLAIAPVFTSKILELLLAIVIYFSAILL